MGLFNKKELAEIQRLNEIINRLSKYESIVDIEDKANQLNLELESLRQQYTSEKEGLISEFNILKDKYSTAKETYNELLKQNDLFRESLDLIEYGVYEPHFNFTTSEKYKEEIISVREKQKHQIKNGGAVLGGENISWNGSAAQGRIMVEKEKKLILRAFNGECDNFINNVEWNNVTKMEERINKSHETINKIYEKQGIYISHTYLKLKYSELQLAYEYKKKLYEEKEEQRQIREQMREEERATKEIENARIKAEKEEKTYADALEKAKKDILGTDGQKYDKMLQQIVELENRLKEAEQNKERAISMAQQTKRGHVYVISNIGSFGEHVYKIGMTRRLEPMDRVKELGDASVPFPFDVHAIIFSDNAPALEAVLHSKFANHRLNLRNLKKEFFHVQLEEIEKEVNLNGSEIKFTKIAIAEEFRESQSLKLSSDPAKSKGDIVKFPSNIAI